MMFYSESVCSYICIAIIITSHLVIMCVVQDPAQYSRLVGLCLATCRDSSNNQEINVLRIYVFFLLLFASSPIPKPNSKQPVYRQFEII